MIATLVQALKFSRLQVLVLLLLFTRTALAQDSFVLDPSIFDQASVEQERIGKVYLSDMYLSPRFDYAEPRSGKFLLGKSYVAADWTRGELISGQFAFGTKSLLGVPARYGAVNPEEFAVIGAYAQLSSDFGRFRLGLQPIPFGLEGGILDANLRFERSFLYQKSWMGIRDLGFGYSISNAGFFNDWLIHNGESGQDLDNQVWFTTRVGFHKNFFTGGLSAQTGKTNPLSTDPTGKLASTPAGSLSTTGIKIDLGAKFRFFNLFFAYRSKDFEASLEATTMDVYQINTDTHPNTGHIDFFVPYKEMWGFLLRYDYFDFKDSVTPTSQSYTIGTCLRSQYETSNLYLYGSRNIMPAPQNDSHQILLVWRVSPFALKQR